MTSVNNVIEFVARETGCNVHDISTESDLSKDVGLDGDDAAELMSKFGRQFNVDMSGFIFNKYFGPEAAFFFLNILLPSWWKSRRKLTPIKIMDLVRAAEAGVWVSESCRNS